MIRIEYFANKEHEHKFFLYSCCGYRYRYCKTCKIVEKIEL